MSPPSATPRNRLGVSAALAVVALAATGCGAQTAATTTTASASPTAAVSTASARPAVAAHAHHRAQRQPELELITEPNEGIAPILGQVKRARRSVDLVMYALSDAAFEAALVADHHRGVDVRVLLNGGYQGAGGFPQNDAAYSYLRDHGVAVRWTPSYFALTHEKAIVIDGRTADIMTLNLTPQYYSSSRDFAVVDRNAHDVAAITGAFDADWSAQQTSPSAGSGDLVWSPGALSPELALINSARNTIDVDNEEMADPEIMDALAAAARRGVDVKVVMTASSDWDSAFTQLAAAGVHVHTYPQDASLYIHAKVILVDSHTALIGSQNFSAGSLEDNRELGIVVTTPAIIASLRSTFTADYGGSTAFAAAHPTGTGTHPTATGSAGCRVHASFSSRYGNWDVYVDGAPADTSVTVTADGVTASWHTDADGYADIYLKAPADAAGAAVHVTAGSATCSGTL